MKCPECGSEKTFTSYTTDARTHLYDGCSVCPHEWNERELIDPAVLLDLVEKAENKEKDDWNPIKRAIYRGDVIDAIEQYLSGDPSALLKLAAGEE